MSFTLYKPQVACDTLNSTIRQMNKSVDIFYLHYNTPGVFINKFYNKHTIVTQQIIKLISITIKAKAITPWCATSCFLRGLLPLSKQ